MKRRRITVELTDAQYEALAGAVAYKDTLHVDDHYPSEDTWRREAAVLDRAWSKINRAWHGAGRVGRSDSCP